MTSTPILKSQRLTATRIIRIVLALMLVFSTVSWLAQPVSTIEQLPEEMIDSAFKLINPDDSDAYKFVCEKSGICNEGFTQQVSNDTEDQKELLIRIFSQHLPAYLFSFDHKHDRAMIQYLSSEVFRPPIA